MVVIHNMTTVSSDYVATCAEASVEDGTTPVLAITKSRAGVSLLYIFFTINKR